ncbi:PhnE/PtxC family ABC transporter permease [Pelagibaculum spongiae]|uniref:ABC transporter permease n=1 Tax=Pelagibaculum spongiae TaxID=2080658 RepID=A0A2V1H103_9GAMM|nr:ABC transporter permease [Pelagibaculum spongiae]PVZ69702.1 ABC transporter permease [Pelagibaculum spongiae]
MPGAKGPFSSSNIKLPKSFSLSNGITTAANYKKLSLLLLALAVALVFVSDLTVIHSDPWFELQRMLIGVVTPDFSQIDQLGFSILTTLAFAILGVAGGLLLGFLLALYYPQSALLRTICALTRSVHELFWGLILIQIFGLSSPAGLLAIAIPYSCTFAKVFAEQIEHASNQPLNALASSHGLAAQLYAKVPLVCQQMKSYILYRTECALRASAILGFIGLPTLGFHLETALSHGDYSTAAAVLYLFVLLAGSLRWWLRGWSWLLAVVVSSFTISWEHHFQLRFLWRFVSQDIVPAPLKNGWVDGWPQALLDWLISLLPQISDGVLNNLQVGFLAMVFSGSIGLIAFPLVADNLNSGKKLWLSRLLLLIVRSLPEFLLAFVLLIVFGPSLLPGLLALAIHNGAVIAYMVARYSEGLHLRDDASRGGYLYFYEVLPRLYGSFLAFLFYRWEVIMRETAVLGVIGIPTLGFYIDSAFEEFRLDRAFLLVFISALLNLLVDQFSRRVRSRLG